MLRSRLLFGLVMGGIVGVGVSGAGAAVITLSPGSPTYSFDTGGNGASGDPNAALNNLFYNNEGSGNLYTGHYLPGNIPGTGTLTYTVDESGFQSLNVSENSGVFQGTASSDSIVGSYSIDGATAVSFDPIVNGSADNNVYHTLPIPLPNSGAHTVSIVYTVTNSNPTGGYGSYGTQLFRSPPGGAAGSTPAPFVVTGVTPEPASMGIVALGAVGLLARRRA